MKTKKKKVFRWMGLVFLTLCLLLAGPCCAIDFNYLLPQAYGLAKIMSKSVKTEKIINDPKTDEEVRHKLMLIRQARRFAEEAMGLKVDGSYTTYYDTGGGPIAWNVTASPKDGLEPVTWEFPIVGKMPYLGYYKLADAEKKRDELLAEGYDVSMGAVEAYSLLGYLDDPIFSPMLEGSDERIVEVVIHELAHANVYASGKSDFNETAATFLGEEGAAQFFEKWMHSYGVRDNLQKIREDEMVFSEMVRDAYDELKALYARTDISSLEKVDKRAEVFANFQQKIKEACELNVFYNNTSYIWVTYADLDNAFVLSHLRYHGGLKYVSGLHKGLGGDLKRTVEALRSVAKKDNPLDMLEENTDLKLEEEE